MRILDKKAELRKRNEPPVLSLAEEIMNAISHGLGAILAIAGMILFLLKSDTGMKVLASLIYGLLRYEQYLCFISF